MSPIKNRYPRQIKEETMRRIVDDRRDAITFLAKLEEEYAKLEEVSEEDLTNLQTAESRLSLKKQQLEELYQEQLKEAEAIPTEIARRKAAGEIDEKKALKLEKKYQGLLEEYKTNYDTEMKEIDKLISETEDLRSKVNRVTELEEQITELRNEISDADKQYAALGGNAEVLKGREDDAFTRLAQQSDIDFDAIQSRAIDDDIQSVLNNQKSAKFLAQL